MGDGEIRHDLMIIAEKNGQGKELGSQRILHLQLDSQFMAGLNRVGHESFKERHNLQFFPMSGNFKGGRFIPIMNSPFLVEVSKVPAACHEPLNHFTMSMETSHSEVNPSSSAKVTSTRWSFSSNRTTETCPVSQPYEKGVASFLFARWHWCVDVPKAVWQLRRDHGGKRC